MTESLSTALEVIVWTFAVAFGALVLGAVAFLVYHFVIKGEE